MANNYKKARMALLVCIYIVTKFLLCVKWQWLYLPLLRTLRTFTIALVRRHTLNGLV